MRKLLSLIVIILGCFQASSQNDNGYLNLDNPTGDMLVWDNGSDLIRVFRNGQYYFCEPNGRIKFAPENLSYVEDFENGFARAKTQSGKWGLLNVEGELVIDTIWSQLNRPAYKTILVGEGNGQFILEDRGSGPQQYEKLDWYLAGLNGELAPLKFTNAIIVNHILEAETLDHFKITADLTKVNFHYLHPLMKAIIRINHKAVTHSVSERKPLIHFSDEFGRLMYSLPYTSQTVSIRTTQNNLNE
ncbi:MAG: hypothetical protein JXR10_15280 [Cyclobacteriaceae bacterium]